MDQGTKLTYDVGWLDGTTVVFNQGFDSETGTVALRTITSASNHDDTFIDESTTQVLQCTTDGVFLVSYTTEYDDELSTAGSFKGMYEASLQPPMQLLPSDLADGSEWQISSDVTLTDSNYEEARESVIEVSAVAAAADPVTVEAGTFDVLEISYSESHDPAVHSWLSVGIGAVKAEYGLLDPSVNSEADELQSVE